MSNNWKNHPAFTGLSQSLGYNITKALREAGSDKELIDALVRGAIHGAVGSVTDYFAKNRTRLKQIIIELDKYSLEAEGKLLKIEEPLKIDLGAKEEKPAEDESENARLRKKILALEIELRKYKK